MDSEVLDNLRELDILIKKRLFSIGKNNGICVPPSPLQVRIFMYLLDSKNNEVSQSDLVNQLKVSKVSISEVISKMVNNGVVKVITSEKDARKNIITITDKGIKIMEDMNASFEVIKGEITKNINRDDLDTFNKVMQQMKKNIKEDKNV